MTVNGSLGRRHAYRLMAILGASEEMLALLESGQISARAGELLAKLEAATPVKAQKLAKKFMAGGISLKGLEEELRRTSTAPKRALLARRDIELRATEHTVRLMIHVDKRQLADDETQRQRIAEALADFLSRVEIPGVRAKAIEHAVAVLP